MAGGKSWTKNWLCFDNSYYKRDLNEADIDLLWLPTDQALLNCPEFKPYFMLYAENEAAFFIDYAAAHLKLSNLGARFQPNGGFSID